MPQSETVQSTPSPEWATLIAALIRAILQLVGAVLGVFGATCSVCSASSGTVMLIAGSIVFVSATAWSLWQKFQQARLDHAGNVASARGGQAVKVVAQDGVPPV